MATPEEIKKQVIETSQIVENTLKSVASQIGDIFQDALSEADGITKIFGKDVQKQLNSLARSTDKMIENQLKINAGQSASKDISKQLLDYQTKREVLEKRINNLNINQNFNEDIDLNEFKYSVNLHSMLYQKITQSLCFWLPAHCIRCLPLRLSRLTQSLSKECFAFFWLF
jgi:DNA-binding ferritin-like protein (Dps family)